MHNQTPLTALEMIMKTDLQLQQDVIAELKWEPAVHAELIGVEVKDGVVTLAGHVDSFAAKWNAERAAQRVIGVKALAVEIDVKLNGGAEHTDADIARSARNMLLWTTYLASDSIKVMVEDGWLTLSGEVAWEFQRSTAATAVRFLTGVRGVSNQIGIKPHVAVSVVKSDIESALKRVVTSDLQKIYVTVNGSEVTLSGSLNSWAERETVNQAVWRTPGVKSVVNHITIAY
jgi:osmotically-inducible protein OsmY